jgi:hypothetical protein
MNKISYYIGLGVVFACIAGFLAPSVSANATKTKSVVFDQYQEEEFPGISQSLRGVDVVFNCPGEDNPQGFGPLVGFSANREGSTSTGIISMIAAPGAAAGDTGTITEAKITPHKFKLEGTFGNTAFGHDIICTEPLPTTFVIDGPCGVNVEVNMVVSNGINASFKGDVACTT